MTYKIVLSYIGIVIILSLCLFTYCCFCHNKKHSNTKFEICMDEDDIFNMILGFIFLPIGLIKLIITLPFKFIMKLYSIK